MIEEPIGEGVAVRDEFGTYRGTGKCGGYAFGIVMNKGDTIGGKPSVLFRFHAVPDTPAGGPSKLIDGFGHEDTEPAQRAGGR